MGCAGSTQEGRVHQSGAGAGAGAAQQTEQYTGDTTSYMFLEADVKMSTSVGLSGSSTQSDQASYYPALKSPYSKGFTLVQFLPVPGQTSIAGFNSAKMKYQGIFSKCSDPGRVQDWNLRIDHCQLNIQAFRSGIFSRESQTTGDSGGLVAKVLEVGALGGRLVCVVCTMNSASDAGMMGALKTTTNMALGVDVIFNIPAGPSDTRYCYSAVSMPITFQSGMTGLMSTASQTQADWTGTLNSHLSQGWKLVDVFLDMSNAASAMQGLTSAAGAFNTIWFFEKEEIRMNSNDPVYEGTIVDYDHKISVGIGGTKAKSSWDPTITDMGRRGWELACIVTTPGTAASGMSAVIKLKMIFQRKIQS